MERRARAQAMREAAHWRGEFVLRSGARASEYFDKYRFEGDPRLLEAIAEVMVPLVPQNVDAIAGLELGGVPIATVLSLKSGLPLRIVRKEAKAYGTGLLAEGGDVAGHRLLIVEDVVTTGGQVLSSADALRKLGATLETVLCVVDREVGGRDALGKAGLYLVALFTTSELLDVTEPKQVSPE
jgi:orotate phosphoribosyltransferase